MPIKNTDCAATFKVLIVGDSGVGKSAILKCLMGKGFDERSRPTVGVDFVTKIIEADGALIELRIWDTAGLESFRSMTRRQFQGVQGVFLVYDVTSRISFDSLNYWLSVMSSANNNGSPSSSSFPSRHSYEPVPFMVLGNKSDQTDSRTVGLAQGLKMANNSMAFGFYETSAKTGKNVFEAVHKMAFTITDINYPKLMKSYHRHQIRPLGTIYDVMSSSHPPTSSVVTMRQRSTPSSSSSSKASSERRHTVSALPFNMLRTKTKTIKKNAKRKSWSVSLSTKPEKKNRESPKKTKTKRYSFGGWERKRPFSFFPNRNSTETFSKKNRNGGNFSSNIIMSESSGMMEREKVGDVTLRREKSEKKEKENGRRKVWGVGSLFACFGSRKKRKRGK